MEIVHCTTHIIKSHQFQMKQNLSLRRLYLGYTELADAQMNKSGCRIRRLY